MLRKIWKSRSGNFGILSAVLMLPLLLAAGVAVDYSNLSRLRSNLQNANDAAALMAAQEYDETGKLPKKADVETKLQGNIGTAANVVKIKLDGDNLVLSSSASANMIFSGILPVWTSQVEVLSAVKIQNDEQLDVVLVLDNTYSMTAEGKIDALKNAARDFVHTLLALNTNGRKNVRIGIVPFSNYVNIGMTNRHANWMWVPNDMRGSDPVSRAAGCSNQCAGWTTTTDDNDCWIETYTNDGVVTGTAKKCRTTSTCTGGEKQVCHPATTGTHNWSVTWHGCVGSRGPYPNNVSDTLKTPFIGLPDIVGLSVAGTSAVSCPTPITPLTTEEPQLNSDIQAMKATGNTYIAPGVMWGLRVLSEAAPYTESAENKGQSKKVEHEKIMVLMTDGDNTKSPQLAQILNIPAESASDFGFNGPLSMPNPYNNGNDRALADKMTQDACQAVKDAKVTVYSVSFGSDVSASGKALMQGCADKGKFYDASQVAEISDAFHAIATSIASIRLTQ